MSLALFFKLISPPASNSRFNPKEALASWVILNECETGLEPLLSFIDTLAVDAVPSHTNWDVLIPKLKLDGTLQSKIGGVILNSAVGRDTKILPFTSNVDVVLSLLDKTKSVPEFVVISGILSCLLFVKFVIFDV